jgi:hypothetical protein
MSSTLSSGVIDWNSWRMGSMILMTRQNPMDLMAIYAHSSALPGLQKGQHTLES